MNNDTIIFPVFALVFLTFFIGMWMCKLRFRAVKNKELKISYFRYNNGDDVPEKLMKVSNNFHNLLEIPLLFYSLIVFLYITNSVNIAQIILAWSFVLLRYIHSFIHTGSNNIVHRFMSFLSSVAILMIMWVLFFINMIIN